MFFVIIKILMESNLKVVIFLLLVLSFLAIPDTTLCPLGFSITQVNHCSYQFGPCMTTNYDAAIPTFATTCLTCYSDAHLVTMYSSLTATYVKGCIPKLCTSFFSGSNEFIACAACAPGYFLTANRSCILQASIAGLATANNTISTSTVNTTNSSSLANTTNSSTTSPNTTTPSTVTPNTSTPSTIIPTVNSTVGSSSSSQDYIIASIIVSSGAVVCMLMWIAFKVVELIKLKPNQQVLPEKRTELREEIEIKETREFKRRRNKDKDNTVDQQQISFSQIDEIIH